jgi:hypothetical protein
LFLIENSPAWAGEWLRWQSLPSTSKALPPDLGVCSLQLKWTKRLCGRRKQKTWALQGHRGKSQRLKLLCGECVLTVHVRVPVRMYTLCYMSNTLCSLERWVS